jgi:putative ABC transport system permease protein
MSGLERDVMDILSRPLNIAGIVGFLVLCLLAYVYWDFTRLIFKNLRRNLLLSILSSVVIMGFVIVVTMIWTVLTFLDSMTTEKSKNFKIIVTEKHQLPSQMPLSYANDLETYAPSPDDTMTWQFYGGSIKQNELTPSTVVFFFCMEPKKLITFDKNGKYDSMMDGIEDFTDEERNLLGAACKEMEEFPYKVLIGQERLDALNKKVGERIKVYSINYQDIDLEVEIMGALPPGRYGQSAVMNCKYLNGAMDRYERDNKKKHPMYDRSLNLVWMRVRDRAQYEKIAAAVETSPKFKTPAIKVETASSGISTFLDAYRDLLAAVRWGIVPVALFTIALVIAIAISLGIRARRTELAVMKVLGFTPNMVLVLVLGEALILGIVSGVISAVGTKLVVNEVFNGVKIPIAFFPAFKVPDAALLWGLTIGAVTSLAGSLVPAWFARNVKVSEVFSKIA